MLVSFDEANVTRSSDSKLTHYRSFRKKDTIGQLSLGRSIAIPSPAASEGERMCSGNSHTGRDAKTIGSRKR